MKGTREKSALKQGEKTDDFPPNPFKQGLQ